MSHRHVRRNVVHSSTEPCPWPDECVEHLRCGGCGSLLAGIDNSECDFVVFGYPWCRPCGEHHRPPECSIDSLGRSLDPWGNPWDDQ